MVDFYGALEPEEVEELRIEYAWNTCKKAGYYLVSDNRLKEGVIRADDTHGIRFTSHAPVSYYFTNYWHAYACYLKKLEAKNERQNKYDHCP